MSTVYKQNVEPAQVKVTDQHRSPWWEIAGFFVMMAAVIVGILFGPVGWATWLMLLAIYCAVMR